MTHQTLVATRVMVGQGRRGSAALDRDEFVEPFLIHEDGVEFVGPAVSDAVNAFGSADKDASFQAAFGHGIIVRLNVEIFNENSSRWELPRIVLVEGDFVGWVRNGEPTQLFGAVGPEWQIYVVRDDARMRREVR